MTPSTLYAPASNPAAPTPVNFDAINFGPVTQPITTPTAPAPTVPPTSTPQAITPAALTNPTTPVVPNIPVYTPPPPAPTLQTPSVTQTPGEQQVSTLDQQLEDLINQGTGESAFRTDQETALGLPAANQTVSDLTARMTALTDEAKQIPLQIQNDEQGRGVTLGGVQPLQDAAVRRNAIQTLTVSAQLDAAKGNLALAQDKVDKAVAAKFDPIKAHIDALQKNLDIIKNSPEYSIEEKNQAQQQQDYLDNQKATIQQAQDDHKTIYSVMLAAAQNGADANTLRNIENATTPDAAIAAAGTSLQSNKTQIINANGKVEMIDSNTGKVVAELGTSDAALKLASDAQNAKPPTVAQMTYGNYAPRLQAADSTINDLTANITKLNPVSLALQQKLPSWLQSSDVQQYNQAKLNFINSVLRQESGAAISQGEYDKYSQQYFPVPGDSAQTIALKAQNRQQVINSYVKNAGSAYTAPAVPSTPGADQYADYRSQLQSGEILVQRGTNIVAITPDELLSSDQQL